MRLFNKLKIKGVFELKIYKNGKLIEDYIDNNLVVTVGKTNMCKLLADDGTTNYLQSIAFGTSTVAPTIVDTIITDEYTKSFESYEYPDEKSVKFNWELLTTENNGVAISEFGLKCADGTLFARKTRGTIEKESDVYLSGSWTISFV